MDTQTNPFPRRSQMSTIAVGTGFRPRTRPTAPAVRPARAATAPLRLTRRGRVALTLVFLGLLLAAFTMFGSHSAATGEAGAPVATRTVVVGQGDTLWDLATEVAAPGEVREMVHQIEELNALTGPGLAVGQRIAVPVR
jgi:hypothetical protein